jgi:hypothetical protein
MDSKVCCDQVYIKTSLLSSPDNIFDGAFARKAFKEGDLVEKGLMRRLSDNENRGFDGMKNPYVFTWSDDVPNYTWAAGSGCSPFYNTAKDGTANTRMVRFFDEDRFEIYATRDITADEELVHTYKSLGWRTVFKELNELLTN